MTIDRLKKDLFARFQQSSFSHCSYDDQNKQVLIDNKTIVIYDFDAICADLIANIDVDLQTPSSLDSIYLNDRETIHFLEFKNTKWSKVKKDDLKLKIYESLALLNASYQLATTEWTGTRIYLIHKTDAKVNAAHTRLNGTCPPQFRFIEEMLNVAILRYDADTFEKYINKHTRLP